MSSLGGAQPVVAVAVVVPLDIPQAVGLPGVRTGVEECGRVVVDSTDDVYLFQVKACG